MGGQRRRKQKLSKTEQTGRTGLTSPNKTCVTCTCTPVMATLNSPPVITQATDQTEQQSQVPMLSLSSPISTLITGRPISTFSLVSTPICIPSNTYVYHIRGTVPTPPAVPNIAMQMIFTYFQIMNNKMEKMEGFIIDKLSKLDLLEQMN